LKMVWPDGTWCAPTTLVAGAWRRSLCSLSRELRAATRGPVSTMITCRPARGVERLPVQSRAGDHDENVKIRWLRSRFAVIARRPGPEQRQLGHRCIRLGDHSIQLGDHRAVQRVRSRGDPCDRNILAPLVACNQAGLELWLWSRR